MAPWLVEVALRCYRELHEHIPLLAEEGWMRRQPAGWRRRRGGRTGETFRPNCPPRRASLAAAAPPLLCEEGNECAPLFIASTFAEAVRPTGVASADMPDRRDRRYSRSDWFRRVSCTCMNTCAGPAALWSPPM